MNRAARDFIPRYQLVGKHPCRMTGGARVDASSPSLAAHAWMARSVPDRIGTYTASARFLPSVAASKPTPVEKRVFRGRYEGLTWPYMLGHTTPLSLRANELFCGVTIGANIPKYEE